MNDDNPYRSPQAGMDGETGLSEAALMVAYCGVIAAIAILGTRASAYYLFGIDLGPALAIGFWWTIAIALPAALISPLLPE